MPVTRIPKPTRGFVSNAELERQYFGGAGWQTVEASGGGGGELPSWWTVDSSPGNQSVSFAGQVLVAPSFTDRSPFQVTGADGLTENLAVFADANGGFLKVGPSGELTISPSATNVHPLEIETPTGSTFSTIIGTAEGGGFEVRPNGSGDVGIRVYEHVNGDTLFDVGPSGAVTISPSADVHALHAIANGDDSGNFGLWASSETGNAALQWTPFRGLRVDAGIGATQLVVVRDEDAHIVLDVSPTGAVTISPTLAETGNPDSLQIITVPDGWNASDSFWSGITTAFLGEHRLFSVDAYGGLLLDSPQYPDSSPAVAYLILQATEGATGTKHLQFNAGAAEDTNSAIVFREVGAPSSRFEVTETGSVSILPSAAGTALYVKAAGAINAGAFVTEGYSNFSAPTDSYYIDVRDTLEGFGGVKLGDVDGSPVIMIIDSQKLGFFNHPPAVRPTGVPVTAAGVHGALVSLGLITA